MSDHSQRINDLPSEERPRERMQRLGAAALSGAELLAIFLRTGTAGASAIEIGRQLIHKYGSLSALGRLSIEDLRQEHGLGLAKACQLKAAFELGLRASRENLQSKPLDSPEAIYDYFRRDLEFRNTETVIVATLNTRFQLRRWVEISKGTANSTTAVIRDVIRPALIDQAPSFLVIHNHPSGNPTPSSADDRFTRELVKAADLFRLTLADHLIIGRPLDGRKGYFSYQESHFI